MARAFRLLWSLALVLVLASGMSEGSDEAVWFADRTTTTANLRAGMMFNAGLLSVLVPPPGTRVSAEAVLTDGTMVLVSLETRDDGSVVVYRAADVRSTPAMAIKDGAPSLPIKGDTAAKSAPRWPDPVSEIRRVVREVQHRVQQVLQPAPQPPQNPPTGPKRRISSVPGQRPRTRRAAVGGGDLGTLAVLGACSDAAYVLAGPKWTTPFRWYLSTATMPSNLSVANVETAFQRSVSRMVDGYNNCGRADGIRETASYSGRTSTAAEINSSASCLQPDGKSELGFQSLPSGYVGLGCWWSSSGTINQGDVAFNKSVKWYVTKPATCLNQWSLEAVAAHELGHVFGLSHVSELEHPNLTMAPKIMACQNAEITLGLGDLKALEALYSG